MKSSSSSVPRWLIPLLVFVVPAAQLAYVTHNLGWLIAVPIGILSLMIALAFVFGTLERLFGIGRRKSTPEEFANALEKHLLGTEEPWDWDDATGVVLADPRLERVRLRLGPNLDSLKLEKDKEELRAIIASIRRGDLPAGEFSSSASTRLRNLFRFRKKI